MLPDQNNVKSYNIYKYTFLDDLSFTKSPHDYFNHEEEYRVNDAIQLISDRFKEAGWEGDGAIGIIWLPPFVGIGTEDTYGTSIWHVKQDNNGISFLACETSLNFDRITEQNKIHITYDISQEIEPISIIKINIGSIKDKLEEMHSEMRETLSFLHNNPSSCSSKIRTHLLFSYHNNMVQLLNKFLDECYLCILKEAMNPGNPNKLKLKKSKVTIDATSYFHTPDNGNDIETIEDTATWFTTMGLITDMWKAYKWEPFKTKTDMLFSSIDYAPDKNGYFEIHKHVILRNCMQHHEAKLDRDSLKSLGVNKITILADNNTKETIEVWKPIILSSYELDVLVTHMTNLMESFSSHVSKRIPTL